MYAAIIMPYKVAFVDYENFAWDIFDYCVDIMFFLDVIVNLLTSYYDNEENLVTDRKVTIKSILIKFLKIKFQFKKKIIKNYILGWFSIDILASLPLDLILGNSVGNG